MERRKNTVALMKLVFVIPPNSLQSSKIKGIDEPAKNNRTKDWWL